MEQSTKHYVNSKFKTDNDPQDYKENKVKDSILLPYKADGEVNAE